jgi:hypothetical protein
LPANPPAETSDGQTAAAEVPAGGPSARHRWISIPSTSTARMFSRPDAPTMTFCTLDLGVMPVSV